MADEAYRRAASRLGRLLLALISVGLLWVINVSPGWQTWSFLTADFADVVTLLNVALAVAAVNQVVHAVSHKHALLGLGEAVAATLTLVVLARLFVAFPFSLSEGAPTWIVRGLLVIGMVGAFAALVTGSGLVARRLYVRGHLQRRRH